jgi:hypothetical protein
MCCVERGLMRARVAAGINPQSMPDTGDVSRPDFHPSLIG